MLFPFCPRPWPCMGSVRRSSYPGGCVRQKVTSVRFRELIVASVVVVAALATPLPVAADVIVIPPNSGLLQNIIVNSRTENRIVEVMLTGVNGVSGLWTAPDPFTAPLLSDPDAALGLAYAGLGVVSRIPLGTQLTHDPQSNCWTVPVPENV